MKETHRLYIKNYKAFKHKLKIQINGKGYHVYGLEELTVQ